jgi:hypothetical protein
MLFFCTATQTLFAQPLLFGIKGGVPFTNAFQFTSSGTEASTPGRFIPGDSFIYSSDTKRYTVGPAIEARLPRGLAVEFDALYKRLNYDHTFYHISFSSTSITRATGNALSRWEFPLLLKYRLPIGSYGPHITAGASANYIRGPKSNTNVFLRGPFTPPSSRTEESNENPFELKRVSTGGIVVGSGWEFRAGVFRISPELRYTRWMNSNFIEEPQVPARLRSHQNQLELLFGLMF